MATAPTTFIMVPGSNGQEPQPGIVYTDANKSIAGITMPWVLNASGILVPWPVAADGTPQVELNGSNVPQAQVETFINNAYNVSGVTAGTVYYNNGPNGIGPGNPVAVAGYNRRSLAVYNNANQSVTIQLLIQTTFGAPYNSAMFVAQDASKTLNPGTFNIYDVNDFPHIDVPTDYLTVSFVYATVPTLDGAGTAGTTPQLTIGVVASN